MPSDPVRPFAPLRTLQRYEHVAERLAAEIRSGAFAPGERLPSERDLARRLEVGRASVREAIAALQVQGVIETRPGSGSFVAADAAERLPAPSGLPHDASPSDLLEARALLEPAIARLAAERGRPDAERRAAARRDGGRRRPARIRPPAQGWNESDRLFHRQIAAMTGNPVLAGIADHVAALMDQPLWQRLRDDSIATPGHTRHPPRRAPHDLRGDRRGRPRRRRALRRPARQARAPLHDPRLTGARMRFPGIIPAVTTPFDADGGVDAAALAANVRFLLDAGVHGIVGTGTMGEAGSLDARRAPARARDGRRGGRRRRCR